MNKILLTLILILNSCILNADVGILSRVVDGDTVEFGNTVCRLAYIDTPESHPNEKAKRDISVCSEIAMGRVVEAGKLAAKFTSSQLSRGKSYKYDVVDVDHYGRKVCLIEVNGGSLNLGIVASGYAVPYERYIPDYDVKREFAKYKKEAKMKNSGLWENYGGVLDCMDRK